MILILSSQTNVVIVYTFCDDVSNRIYVFFQAKISQMKPSLNFGDNRATNATKPNKTKRSLLNAIEDFIINVVRQTNWTDVSKTAFSVRVHTQTYAYNIMMSLVVCRWISYG